MSMDGWTDRYLLLLNRQNCEDIVIQKPIYSYNNLLDLTVYVSQYSSP
jgi:hypothetical protein